MSAWRWAALAVGTTAVALAVGATLATGGAERTSTGAPNAAPVVTPDPPGRGMVVEAREFCGPSPDRENAWLVQFRITNNTAAPVAYEREIGLFVDGVLRDSRWLRTSENYLSIDRTTTLLPSASAVVLAQFFVSQPEFGMTCELLPQG